MNFNTLTDKELRDILITCDGKGKEIKEKVLEELLRREYNRGVVETAADALT